MEIATINENTPFRFITRKGTTSELMKCILSEGELGYTTDAKRLYVGDGVTAGGNPIHNIVLSSENMELPSEGLIAGDIVYNNSQIKIYTGVSGIWNTYLINYS